MNKYISMGGILALVLSAFELQAYTFTIKNFTNKQHEVAIQLKGPGQKPSETQTVEPYGAQPSLFAQVKSKVQGWVKDLQGEWSNKLAQLSQEVNTTTAEAMQKKLSDLQTDIDKKIKAGMLKVGAKQWVNDLNALKNDVQKGINNLDRQKLAKKLDQLQGEMNQKLADLSNSETATELDTAIFSYPLGELRAAFCLNKVLVDGNALPIYGISPKEYDSLQATFKTDQRKFLGLISDGINEGRFSNMTKTLVGICFSRQFDIVDLGNNNLVIIAREKI